MWEYKQLLLSHAGEIEESLNELGADGWDLASTMCDAGIFFVFLKRRIETK